MTAPAVLDRDTVVAWVDVVDDIGVAAEIAARLKGRIGTLVGPPRQGRDARFDKTGPVACPLEPAPPSTSPVTVRRPLPTIGYVKRDRLIALIRSAPAAQQADIRREMRERYGHTWPKAMHPNVYPSALQWLTWRVADAHIWSPPAPVPVDVPPSTPGRFGGVTGALRELASADAHKWVASYRGRDDDTRADLRSTLYAAHVMCGKLLYLIDT